MLPDKLFHVLLIVFRLFGISLGNHELQQMTPPYLDVSAMKYARMVQDKRSIRKILETQFLFQTEPANPVANGSCFLIKNSNPFQASVCLSIAIPSFNS